MTDQAEGLRRMTGLLEADPSPDPDVQPKCRCIAITSGKGGVGKTNLAVNLGVAFSSLGLRTGVLDADLGLANIDILLGIVPAFNLSHVLYGQKRLEEILLDGPKGLKIVAGGSGVHELANLSQWRLERFVRSLARLDSILDILLVDTGAGISKNVLSFVLAAEEVIVVTTPEPTSMTDAYSMVKVIAAQSPTTRVGLVVNMAKDAREAEAVCRKLETVAGRFLRVKPVYLGYLPPDEIVTRSVHEQTAFAASYPNSRAARAIYGLVEVILGSPHQASASGISRLFRRMAGLFR